MVTLGLGKWQRLWIITVKFCSCYRNIESILTKMKYDLGVCCLFELIAFLQFYRPLYMFCLDDSMLSSCSLQQPNDSEFYQNIIFHL